MSKSKILAVIAIIGGVASQLAMVLQYLKPGTAAVLGAIALFIAGGTEKVIGKPEPPQQ